MVPVSGPYQSNELSVLSVDDGSIFPAKYLERFTSYSVRVFQSFGAWIMHSCTLQYYTATITIFIS